MTKSARAKSAAGAAGAKATEEEAQPADVRLGGGFVEVGQAVGRLFSSLAGAWGFAAVTALVTLFAVCYSRAERGCGACGPRNSYLQSSRR